MRSAKWRGTQETENAEIIIERQIVRHGEQSITGRLEMELKQAIMERRSTRSYTDRALTRAEIETILLAGINAPSACNMQSWHFYVVADEKEREKFRGVCADWVASAPVVIIVCTDKSAIEARFGERARKFPVQDTALAMENMLLCATDMGLGGCIIGAYNQDACVKAFDIPDNHVVVALLPIGEPAEKIPPRERKPLEDVVTFIGDVSEECKAGESESCKPQKYELRSAWLPGAVFEDLNLDHAVFDDVNLSGGSFNNINMSGVRFSDINMKGTSFCGMTFEGARFGCVEMQHARFENVDFTGAEFVNCDFTDTKRVDQQ